MSGERVLVIDDDAAAGDSIRAVLEKKGYSVRVVQSGPNGLYEVRSARPAYDAILVEVAMPEIAALDVVHARLSAAVIVLYKPHERSTADRCVKAGATSSLEKPINREKLLSAVEGAFARKVNKYQLVGDSQCMRDLNSQIAQVAPTSTTVLITGETGTGKELVARRIHELSLRSHRPFVPVNSAAIPSEMIESKLFGHAKGSFTGAVTKERGRFVEADGGTIFLDEIGDLSFGAQAKLLRVLEDGEVDPVGGQVVRVDVRVIAATNKNLDDEVRDARFRRDLYSRLNVYQITTVPLRDRIQDLAVLTTHLIAILSKKPGLSQKTLSAAAMDALASYDWPENIRQLRNVLERSLITARAETIELDDLPDYIRTPTIESGASPVPPSQGRGTGSKAFTRSSASWAAGGLKTIPQMLGALVAYREAAGLPKRDRLNAGHLRARYMSASAYYANVATIRETIAEWGLPANRDLAFEPQLSDQRGPARAYRYAEAMLEFNVELKELACLPSEEAILSSLPACPVRGLVLIRAMPGELRYRAAARLVQRERSNGKNVFVAYAIEAVGENSAEDPGALSLCNAIADQVETEVTRDGLLALMRVHKPALLVINGFVPVGAAETEWMALLRLLGRIANVGSVVLLQVSNPSHSNGTDGGGPVLPFDVRDIPGTSTSGPAIDRELRPCCQSLIRERRLIHPDAECARELVAAGILRRDESESMLGPDGGIRSEP